MPPPEKAYICAGSNLGDSRRILAEAVGMLEAASGMRALGRSAVYHTEPREDRDQPWFFNQVLCLESGQDPLDLLHVLQNLEDRFGRGRGERRFGPRILDLDLLLYGGRVMDTPELCLPHPRLAERAFVLAPLLEIAPGLVLPDGRKAADLLAKLDFTLRHGRIWQGETVLC